jgi:hypothetical protein
VLADEPDPEAAELADELELDELPQAESPKHSDATSAETPARRLLTARITSLLLVDPSPRPPGGPL